jgi:uncharacterized protein with PIN domain
MVETLMVRCKACNRSFAAPLQVDRATLEALVLAERYRCPTCRRDAVYVKADHFHVLVQETEPQA